MTVQTQVSNDSTHHRVPGIKRHSGGKESGMEFEVINALVTREDSTHDGQLILLLSGRSIGVNGRKEGKID